MQERQHEKEKRFIDFLVKTGTAKDVHDDFSTGVDVYLFHNNIWKPFDLKVSNSKKLTAFKCYKGKWYSPLLLHMDVPYLYVLEEETRYVGFVITKQDILRTYTKYESSEYRGDGNINICITIDNMTDLAKDILVWEK